MTNSRVQTPNIITDALTAFSNEIPKLGFSIEEKLITLDETQVKSWARQYEWKQDIFEVTFPEKNADSLILHYRIFLPAPDNKRNLLDGTTVGFLRGRKIGRYYLPTKLTRMIGGDSRFICTLINDVHRTISWFDAYDTPSKCLHRLQSGETIHGLAKGKFLSECISYLKSLR